MAAALTTISARELIQRILGGDRDFAHTFIPRDQSLETAEGYGDLLEYLRGQDLRSSPLNAEGAEWQGLKAPQLLLSFSKLSGANLAGADLRGADFRRADLSGADLNGSDLGGATMIGANLQRANLRGARMRETDLYEAGVAGANLQDTDLTRAFLLRLATKEADFTGATLTNVLFYRADLRGAVGLTATRDLGTATFHQTIVTRRELDIIQAAMSERPMFDVREE